MFEKVNPSHPDKVADRIAGAIVDLAYKKEHYPTVAVEVLIGHGECNVIIETTFDYDVYDIKKAIDRISDCKLKHNIKIYKQDEFLNNNQKNGVKCGDNGIFKGVPLSEEEKELSKIARNIYEYYYTDGKYILDGSKLIICQSWSHEYDLHVSYPDAIVNPLGEWFGGLDVDSGATNRKLGSDMGSSVTGGGLHGKDLSKADVSLNIYAFLKAQESGKTIELSCAIGDDVIDGVQYSEIVEIARNYINSIGGFEKFAEWGLI